MNSVTASEAPVVMQPSVDAMVLQLLIACDPAKRHAWLKRTKPADEQGFDHLSKLLKESSKCKCLDPWTPAWPGTA